MFLLSLGQLECHYCFGMLPGSLDSGRGSLVECCNICCVDDAICNVVFHHTKSGCQSQTRVLAGPQGLERGHLAFLGVLVLCSDRFPRTVDRCAKRRLSWNYIFCLVSKCEIIHHWFIHHFYHHIFGQISLFWNSYRAKRGSLCRFHAINSVISALSRSHLISSSLVMSRLLSV